MRRRRFTMPEEPNAIGLIQKWNSDQEINVEPRVWPKNLDRSNPATSLWWLTLNLRAHGGWNISTATALNTSLFLQASRRRCGRAIITMPSNAARLALASQTPRSFQQRKPSSPPRNKEDQFAKKRRPSAAYIRCKTMAREELTWQNIDADDLPADVKKS